MKRGIILWVTGRVGSPASSLVRLLIDVVTVSVNRRNRNPHTHAGVASYSTGISIYPIWGCFHPRWDLSIKALPFKGGEIGDKSMLR